ncbi:MAG: hypothetical protein U9R19_07930, partial [Bacteroidota bacterium]|nr:hypothetical protein [Bacteroidota bacterium]
PGIKKNGIAASRAKYPFYTKYQVDTVLIGTEVLLLEPEVKYRDEIIIDWYENFEDPGISLDTTTSSHVGITDSIANGSNVAKIELKGEFEDFKAESINNYTFPEPGSSLYFEMDYKCNHEFVVGLNIKTSGSLVNQPIMLINPMYHWNKIYIDLSYISTINFNADNYTVYFAVAKKDTVERAEVLIDNIKLIHY